MGRGRITKVKGEREREELKRGVGGGVRRREE